MNEWLTECMTNWLTEWMNGWMTEWLNELMSEVSRWIDESAMIHWINRSVNESTNQWSTDSVTQRINESMIQWALEPTNQWIHESMNQWMKGWMDEWLDGWANYLGNNATGRLGVNGVFVIYASRIATTSKLGENAAGKNYYFSLHLLFFMCFDNAFSKSLGFCIMETSSPDPLITSCCQPGIHGALTLLSLLTLCLFRQECLQTTPIGI